MIRKYVNLFMTKFLLFAPVAGILMPSFSGMTTANSVIAALVAAVAAFLTADLVVFPRYGNMVAVAADAVISAAVLLEIAYIFGTTLSWPGLGLITALIALGEWYYHSYLNRVLFSGRRRG